jgi:hypothetical protein
MIIVYDCIFVCLIFQFKIGVKLKWGCVEPLVPSYFWWLGKITKNRSVIFLAAMHRPPKINQ